MRRFLNRLIKDTSGAILIYVSVSIAALCGMAIIAVDISRMLVARVQLQNAADAGALAGARMFLDSPIPTDSQIHAEAEDMANRNTAFASGKDEYIPTENIDTLVDMDLQQVTVTTRSDVSQYFTGILADEGLTRFGIVRATATAMLGEVCDLKCIKPWAIPDRYNDNTMIVGYDGSPPADDDWNNNDQFDREEFTDLNDDALWQPGEPYVDENGNGSYDMEFYHPLITGYTADKDHGLELRLKSNQGNTVKPSYFFPITLPDEDGNYPTGGAIYRWNIANCNPAQVQPGDVFPSEPGNMQGPTVQGMRQLIAQDPNAYWNGAGVADSDFSVSPRIGIIPITDPRIWPRPGRKDIHVVKLAAFFIQDVSNQGEVHGYFMKLQFPGGLCPEGETAGGFIYTLSLIK